MNTQRELYCPLTPHELSQRSAELAHLIQKQTETEAEKKSVMSSFTDRINKGIMDIRVMARVVAEERERRQVDPLLLEALETLALTPGQVKWENREGKCYIDRKENAHATTE